MTVMTAGSNRQPDGRSVVSLVVILVEFLSIFGLRVTTPNTDAQNIA